MKLLIGADLVPTASNRAEFAASDVEALVGQELLDILNGADYRIFNLEVPLTDTKTPIEKCGPALCGPTDTVAGYKALGVDLLTIANNHIMDQGEQGYYSTVKLLEENGIAHVGGGCDPEQAAKPYIVELGGKKVGIYACAEHEFSIVADGKPGANPFDPLESPDHVAALKAQCDYVIVLYHGGKEHYRYPSPNLQKVCRKLVQKGADLVVCQHSHCIGCEEKYLHGTIVYGQGNFLFDRDGSEYKASGLLIAITDCLTLDYIPLIRDEIGARLATPEERAELLQQWNERNEEIKSEAVLKQRYTTFAKGEQTRYLVALSGINDHSLLWRGFNKITGYRWGKWVVKRRFTRKKRTIIHNYVACETQRELLLAGIQEDQV